MTNISTISFLASNIILTLMTSISLAWLFWQKDLSWIHKGLILILVIGTGLIALGQFVVATNDVSPFWRWLFNVDNDRNIPATFSALVWLVLSVLLIQYGRNKQLPLLQRLFWWGLGLAFVWIAFDDYYAFHEILINDWLIVYITFASIVAILGLITFFIWLLPDFMRKPVPFIFMGIGIVMLGYSAFYMEGFSWAMCDEPMAATLCQNMSLLRSPDEIFELLAPIVIIGAFIVYIQPRLSDGEWRRTAILWIGITLLATVVMVGYLYPLPILEQHLLAQPVQVQYGDELELLGYWINNPTPKPGERVYLFLYWQTPNHIHHRYNLSVHLLSYLQRQSYAQADRVDVGQIPDSGWLPGVTIRGAVHLDIPDDIPTPASYIISVRVAENLANPDKTKGLTITNSNLEVPYEDTVFIARLPILDANAPRALTHPTAYQFADGFALAGYDIPTQAKAGESVDLAFRWQASLPVQRSMHQFIHILSDDGELVVGDSPPFAGNFPTEDWIAGLDSVDTVSIPLDADVTPGTYHIYTGMYDTQTTERIPVLDADQQPLLNNIIDLGTLQIIAP